MIRRRYTNRILLVTRSRDQVLFFVDNVFPGSFWSYAVAPPQSADLPSRIRADDPDLVMFFIDEDPGGALIALSHIMLQSPVPVLLVTSAPDRMKTIVLKCLEIGAVDVVSVPRDGEGVSKEHRARLIKTIDQARRVIVRAITLPQALACIEVEGYQDADYLRARERLKQELISRRNRDAIGIAISTGGPHTLSRFLPELPEALPVPVFIVQHIIKGFIDNIAKRLDSLCSMRVKLADQSEPVKAGVIYLAPDGRHLTLRRDDGRVLIHLTEKPEGLLFRPCADVMFQSMAEVYGSRCIGSIMTGMGQDGVAGLRALKQCGASTVAQDQDTSIIYGMARVAVEQHVIDHVVPLEKMSEVLVNGVFTPVTVSAGTAIRRFTMP